MSAPLIPAPLRERLIANYRSNRDGEADHPPVVKLFTPDAQATWLLSELDPEDGLLFGLCDLGIGCAELGYVALAELETVRGPLGLPVERDQWFGADRPLSAYAREASAAGRIMV
ncbi:DUF2958 domain-containing protein [Mameliella sp. CS4]|uniref:DUF2958 domain-containing protein n=1 Tax=Mameliella sp. CS4 TaxID=2862329 RepID=UPI001C606157|nr:DUF2958 domain-containing protein [Mameliella sp. CS4]MBW4985856.1 DUF2958 domain-containing protein [Mameliella sp. CS4]